MKESHLKKKFSKNENIVFREEEEFGLLFDIETGKINKINKKAVALWKSIDSRKTVADIVDELKKEYNDTLPEDVWKFLSILATMGYIKEI
jgi:hypothetical protein